MKFKVHKSFNRVGTLVSYRNEIYTPQALIKFVNNTMWVTQEGMLENLKYLLEKTYKVDQEQTINQTLIVEEEETKEEETKEEEEEEEVPEANEEVTEGEDDDEWDLFHRS